MSSDSGWECVCVAQRRALVNAAPAPAQRRRRRVRSDSIQKNRVLSQMCSEFLYHCLTVSSMADLDPGAKGAGLAIKRRDRSAAKELCKDEKCGGYNKELGHGHCDACLFAIGIFSRPKKNQVLVSESQLANLVQNPVLSTAATAATAAPELSEYQQICNRLPADHFLQGSPERSDLTLETPTRNPPIACSSLLYPNAEATAGKENATAALPAPAPQSDLSGIGGGVCQNRIKGKHSSPSKVQAVPSAQTRPEAQQIPTFGGLGLADEIPFRIEWGVNVEARWLNEEIGYGVFAITDLPASQFVTSYDGHRCDATSGKILKYCNRSLMVEREFPGLAI
jgi:hypothetical protein